MMLKHQVAGAPGLADTGYITDSSVLWGLTQTGSLPFLDLYLELPGPSMFLCSKIFAHGIKAGCLCICLLGCLAHLFSCRIQHNSFCKAVIGISDQFCMLPPWPLIIL